MQNVTHEMTAHGIPLATPRRLETNRRQSLCSRWRVLFGCRLVTWPRTARNETEINYSAVFSQCPAS